MSVPGSTRVPSFPELALAPGSLCIADLHLDLGARHELERGDLLPLDARWRGALEVPDEVRPLREVVRAAEVAHIERAFEQTGGHRSQTARLLGISRKVLWEKVRDFGIKVPGAHPASSEDDDEPTST